MNYKSIKIIACLLLVFTTGVISAQSLEKQICGLWTVTKVSAGDQTMTPIAKWVKFNAGLTQYSGNGWTQHTIGSWKITTEDSLLYLENENSIEDTYGPFQVIPNGSNMTWEREEDGMLVKVALERAETLPLSHADQAIGLWKAESIMENGEDLLKKTADTNFLVIRWDRRYVFQKGADSRETGVWHTHGHRPVIRLLSEEGDTYDSQWKMVFSDTEMTLEEEGKGGKKMVFTRIHQFPGR